jgi:hypothetical protein
VIFTATYFAKQLPKDDEEGHEISGVACIEPLRIATAHVFSGSAHCRRDDFARRVHE